MRERPFCLYLFLGFLGIETETVVGAHRAPMRVIRSKACANAPFHLPRLLANCCVAVRNWFMKGQGVGAEVHADWERPRNDKPGGGGLVGCS